MTEQEILKKTGEVITDKPLTVTIHISPENKLHAWLQRIRLMPKKRVYTIRQTTMGNLVRISTLLISIDNEELKTFNSDYLEKSYNSVLKYGHVMAQVLAIALNNKKSEPLKKQIDFIYLNLSAIDLYKLLGTVFEAMNVQAFMSSIILIKGANILERKAVSVRNADAEEVSQ